MIHLKKLMPTLNKMQNSNALTLNFIELWGGKLTKVNSSPAKMCRFCETLDFSIGLWYYVFIQEKGKKMNSYLVEFDCINGCGEDVFETNNYGQLIHWVEECLTAFGGGHADIYDEDGDFVEDVEV